VAHRFARAIRARADEWILARTPLKPSKTLFGAAQATKIQLSIEQRIAIALKSIAACL
jgi:hypothetical protein